MRVKHRDRYPATARLALGVDVWKRRGGNSHIVPGSKARGPSFVKVNSNDMIYSYNPEESSLIER